MRWLYVLTLLALLAANAAAEERQDRGIIRDDVQLDLGLGLNPVDRGEFQFVGTVYDRARNPMPGVHVKLFVGGLLADAFTTDSVGQFDFEHVIDFSRDETIILWFVDPSQTATPKAFILKESERSLASNILSPCITRMQVEKTMETTIYLLDSATKARLLAEKQCL